MFTAIYAFFSQKVDGHTKQIMGVMKNYKSIWQIKRKEKNKFAFESRRVEELLLFNIRVHYITHRIIIYVLRN